MRIDLNPDGGVTRYLGSGWADPEDGFIWALGAESWILLPAGMVTRPCYLFIRAWPHTRPGKLEAQRVRIDVNGYKVAEFALSHRRSFATLIDADIAGNRAAMCIRLTHPDNARPSDFPEAHVPDERPLAIAYETIIVEELETDEADFLVTLETALQRPAHPAPVDPGNIQPTSTAFLKDFQSAGDDCEFGLFQRDQGTDTIGLLRFASITIDNLTRALRSGFADIANPARIDVFVPENAPNHDYLAREGRYGLLYHTGIMPNALDAATVKGKETVRLRRLADKFREDVAFADHIFVVKYKDPPRPVQLARLLAAFRRLGPATLLWVREAPDPALAGTAAWLLPGLITGYVDRIDTAPLTNISAASWLAVCQSAHALWHANPNP